MRPSVSNPPGTPVGASAQAGQSAPVVVKPTEPNNGGVLSNSDGKWDIWMGGKPKYDWSRLDINAATTFESPNQLCSTYVSSAQKGYNYRETRLVIKFCRDDDPTSLLSICCDGSPD
jgi:hypothetical protein